MSDTLSRISSFADQLADAEAALAAKEREAEFLKFRIKELSEIAIPELMSEVGMDEFKTTSGLKVSLKKNVFASISEENADAAFAWLDEKGHGGMIRRAVVVEFDKQQEAAAKELFAKIRQEYPFATCDKKIHPQTLKAWATRRGEAGEEIPDAITVRTVTVAKIK